MRERENQAEGGRGRLIDDGPAPLVIAAHELKTPLALMRQLSLELAANPDDEAGADRIARQIQLTAERSLRLTRDITQAERLQSTLFPLEPLNARLVLNGVLDELTPLYEAHDRQLIVRLPRRLPNIISHPDLLRRILLNFGDNALQYADSDGAVVIEGKIIHRHEVMRLGVSDGGPAVQRVRRSRPYVEYGRPAGSGLGLLIADTFAEAIQAKTGVIRKKAGSLYFIDVPISKQLSLV